MQRRHEYECAFEDFLRSRRIPYVAVDEARKALVPMQARSGVGGQSDGGSLKSFDFVIYGQSSNLLVDIKGRKIPARANPLSPGRMESWATQEDVRSLAAWQSLFGPGFEAAFVFVYLCDAQPPDALYQEVFSFRSSWFALRTVLVADYAGAMKPRSERWRTVDVSRAVFERISHPFAACLNRGGDSGPEMPALQPLGLQGSFA